MLNVIMLSAVMLSVVAHNVLDFYYSVALVPSSQPVGSLLRTPWPMHSWPEYSYNFVAEYTLLIELSHNKKC
jgi:hypothetical protein